MGANSAGPPKLGRYHLLESVGSKTFTPREYQVELLDAAKKRNTIVCLGTGAGKTFVAVMLIKELAYQTRNTLENGGKKTIFLVPTGPLVQQQAKVVQDYTDLKVTKFIGSESCQCLEDLSNRVKKNEVIISTPDIFKMVIHHGFISLAEINLIIFDECHRAVRNHSYREIMQCFDVCPLLSQPRILGLSASLINCKCKPSQLEQKVEILESSLRCTVETASALTMLSKYGSKPQEYIVQYKTYFTEDKNYLLLLKIMNEALVFLDDLILPCDMDELYNHPCKQMRRYLVELSHVVVSLGPWCTLHAASLFMDEVNVKFQNIYYEMHKIYLCYTVTTLQEIAMLCEKIMKGSSSTERLVDHAPPKLHELLKLLLKYKPNEVSASKPQGTEAVADAVKPPARTRNERFARKRGANRTLREGRKITHRSHADDAKDLCCLIFVRQRITAYLLNTWLSELRNCDSSYKFISPSYIIGHGSTGSLSKEVTLDSHKQEEVLRKFKSREFNIIVTTSVVEEGLDIPKCNLVIRLDTPENFSAYLQSKGRARATESLFVLMVNSDERERFVDDLSDFKTIEEILLQRSHKSDTTELVVNEEQANLLMEPYMPIKEVGSPRVTMASSIALVNRYCSKLPSDTFTRLTPKWKVKESSTDSNIVLFQCTVQLPINSPLKLPVIGGHMPSKQLAKMAAGLKTCELLHKIGELDDNLLPTGKESVKFDDDFEEEFECENADISARPGTTKRRQYYFKQVADALKYGKPSAGQSASLYVFRMILTCPIPEEQNTRGRKIHDPAASSRSFGIILNKPIPPLSGFPVFTRSGEVTIHVDHVSSSVVLTEEEIDQLAFCHKYTFSHVLRLEKYPMMFCPAEAEFSFFVVPVNKDGSSDYSIDWSFVTTINKQRNIKPKRLTREERCSFSFHEKDYVDAVVMPWYRNIDKPQFFYVAEICSALSPLSTFPGEGFGTFKEYYEKKYSISLVNYTQPLLDVDHTSARLNLLTPRYVNRKGVTLPTSSESTKKIKRENLQQKQILIPELCIIHPFPASLWRKAVCLPCILYRTNSLLLAEQLRADVSRDISIGLSQLPMGFSWPMLDFGWTLADVIKAHANLKDTEDMNANELSSQQYNSVIQDSNSFNNQNNNKNCTIINDDDYSNYLSEKVPASDMETDFEIDVFDPNKYTIPDEIDFIDEELKNINFTMNGGIGQSFSLWENPGKVTDCAESGVRYGSPSNFEISEWDFEGEAQQESNFFTLNLPDLGFISAPGVFDMQSLSRDLAIQRQSDGIWGSFEGSSQDEMDLKEMDYEVDSVIQDDFQELDSSEWLSNCSSQSPPSLIDTQPEECETVDGSVINFVEEIRKRKKNELKFLNLSDPETASLPNKTDPLKFFKVLSAIEQIDCYNGTSAINEADSKNVSLRSDSGEGNGRISDEEVANDIISTLAFGELLPDRDKLKDVDEYSPLQIAFDESPDLNKHPGPSPSIILQALTMSNANDGINLERLETVGDSFLKYAITAYLFCMYPNIHEGKLSFLRSKQISNLNLYRLGKRKGLGSLMVASKFEPIDNWLPPGYSVPKGLEEALINSGLPISQWNISNMNNLIDLNEDEIRQIVMEKKDTDACKIEETLQDSLPLVPYNLLTQHSIPDKSIADCVEALIGAYLVSVGSRGALLFMSWLGLKVLPAIKNCDNEKSESRFGYLAPPDSPLLKHISSPYGKLERLLSGYAAFEDKIGYTFKDKSYLLQAFTHASYYYNKLTDCYQRLEFLGDAVLDYLITRHLYEDPKKHSPGTLTDLRSALVNNTFFASLAVKYDFHKYFKAISPSLFVVINKFIELKQHAVIEDYADSYYIEEDECEEVEEVEVPKALGDIFESVAGAMYLDSNMSLDAVWKTYYAMMKPEIEYFSCHVPKSPIRELLELEPQTAKFEKAEMTLSGKVRVTVEVFGKGHFIGIGRNKRIAKCTAAKRALRELKKKMQRN